MVVIPLVKELTVPDDAPVKLSTAPDVCTLGTLSAIREELENKHLETVTEFKREGREERDRQENEGLGDRWGEKAECCDTKNQSQIYWIQNRNAIQLYT